MAIRYYVQNDVNSDLFILMISYDDGSNDARAPGVQEAWLNSPHILTRYKNNWSKNYKRNQQMKVQRKATLIYN